MAPAPATATRRDRCRRLRGCAAGCPPARHAAGSAAARRPARRRAGRCATGTDRSRRSAHSATPVPAPASASSAARRRARRDAGPTLCRPCLAKIDDIDVRLDCIVQSLAMEKRPSRVQLLDAARRLGPRPVLLAAWHRGAAGRLLARARAARRRTPQPRRAPLAGGGATSARHPSRRPGMPPRCWAALRASGQPTGTATTTLPRRAVARPLRGRATSGRSGSATAGQNCRCWRRRPGSTPAAATSRGRRRCCADWCRANPPFRGPNWACGQEAALRALHLGLALALLGGAAAPAAGAPGRCSRCTRAASPRPRPTRWRRTTTTRSRRPPGCWSAASCSAMRGWRARHGAALGALRRLVAPCGAFAQLSAGYHRLLLGRAGGSDMAEPPPRRPPPRRDGAATARPRQCDGCTAWSILQPAPCRGSGTRTARPSPTSRSPARRMRGQAWSARRGCSPGARPVSPTTPAALGSTCRHARLCPPRRATGKARACGAGAGRAGRGRCCGPARCRFRPGHADLLHLDLWDGALNLLRDGGTGAYNPPTDAPWWHAHLTGTAAHNTIEFDGADQMPRVSRFLFARWPETGRLPDGASMRDHRGNHHARSVRREGRTWLVEDRVSGGFARLALRWRLAPGGVARDRGRRWRRPSRG